MSSTMRLEYAVGATENGAINIAIFDVAGRKVRNLVSGFEAPGRHSVEWNGRNDNGDAVPKGVYFVHGSLGGRTLSTRVLFLH